MNNCWFHYTRSFFWIFSLTLGLGSWSKIKKSLNQIKVSYLQSVFVTQLAVDIQVAVARFRKFPLHLPQKESSDFFLRTIEEIYSANPHTCKLYSHLGYFCPHPVFDIHDKANIKCLVLLKKFLNRINLLK